MTPHYQRSLLPCPSQQVYHHGASLTFTVAFTRQLFEMQATFHPFPCPPASPLKIPQCPPLLLVLEKKSVNMAGGNPASQGQPLLALQGAVPLLLPLQALLTLQLAAPYTPSPSPIAPPSVFCATVLTCVMLPLRS